MKYTISTLALMATSLNLANASQAVNGTGPTVDVEALVVRRRAVLTSWENNALNSTGVLVRSRGVIGPSGERCDGLPALRVNETDGQGGVSARITQVICNGRNSTRRRRLQDNYKPYPEDGSIVELEAAGAEIYFEEDVLGMDSAIACFYFDKDNDGIDISYTCEEIEHYVDYGIAIAYMSGLSAGSWTWWAEDENGVATSKQTFTVEVIGDDGGSVPADFMGEDEWTYGGQIQGASGRIYYSAGGYDYACSGTAIKDHKSGRSLIVTAAHCVWDDQEMAWGSNVVFIPNRDATQSTESAESIHRQCSEDVCGCWTMSAGFVHDRWQQEPWPARLAYDWGIYVVDDVGAHAGTECGSEALDEAVAPVEFEIGVDLATLDASVTGLGYSLEHNPDFRYCVDRAEYNQPTKFVDTYWLPGCGLKGGASGGPWLIDSDKADGSGKLVSVNSWSYTDKAGMGGPIIDAEGARCLVNAARDANFHEIESFPEGEEGVAVNCYDRKCITAAELRADTSEANRRLRGNGRRLCAETDTKA